MSENQNINFIWPNGMYTPSLNVLCVVSAAAPSEPGRQTWDGTVGEGPISV